MSHNQNAFIAASLGGCLVLPGLGALYRTVTGNIVDMHGMEWDYWIGSMIVIYIVAYLVSVVRST